VTILVVFALLPVSFTGAATTYYWSKIGKNLSGDVMTVRTASSADGTKLAVAANGGIYTPRPIRVPPGLSGLMQVHGVGGL
jgi:hypothetical protein